MTGSPKGLGIWLADAMEAMTRHRGDEQAVSLNCGPGRLLGMATRRPRAEALAAMARG